MDGDIKQAWKSGWRISILTFRRYFRLWERFDKCLRLFMSIISTVCFLSLNNAPGDPFNPTLCYTCLWREFLWFGICICHDKSKITNTKNTAGKSAWSGSLTEFILWLNSEFRIWLNSEFRIWLNSHYEERQGIIALIGEGEKGESLTRWLHSRCRWLHSRLHLCRNKRSRHLEVFLKS